MLVKPASWMERITASLAIVEAVVGTDGDRVLRLRVVEHCVAAKTLRVHAAGVRRRDPGGSAGDPDGKGFGPGLLPARRLRQLTSRRSMRTGVITMNTIRSTRQTSISGVTLTLEARFSERVSSSPPPRPKGTRSGCQGSRRLARTRPGGGRKRRPTSRGRRKEVPGRRSPSAAGRPCSRRGISASRRSLSPRAG